VELGNQSNGSSRGDQGIGESIKYGQNRWHNNKEGKNVSTKKNLATNPLVQTQGGAKNRVQKFAIPGEIRSEEVRQVQMAAARDRLLLPGGTGEGCRVNVSVG